MLVSTEFNLGEKVKIIESGKIGFVVAIDANIRPWGAVTEYVICSGVNVYEELRESELSRDL